MAAFPGECVAAFGKYARCWVVVVRGADADGPATAVVNATACAPSVTVTVVAPVVIAAIVDGEAPVTTVDGWDRVAGAEEVVGAGCCGCFSIVTCAAGACAAREVTVIVMDGAPLAATCERASRPVATTLPAPVVEGTTPVTAARADTVVACVLVVALVVALVARVRVATAEADVDTATAAAAAAAAETTLRMSRPLLAEPLKWWWWWCCGDNTSLGGDASVSDDARCCGRMLPCVTPVSPAGVPPPM